MVTFFSDFIKTFKSVVLDIELFMQNTFNPLHGYHPKEDVKIGMLKELLGKLKK